MDLNTYESRAIADVFVTLPSAEAATIVLVDKLAAMRLTLVRGGYCLDSRTDGETFLALVSEGIANSGYAVHGFDLAFLDHRAGAP